MSNWGPMITAMATPFDQSGEVDHDAAARLAHHLIATGSTGLLTCGTTGESPTLSHDEKLALTKTVLEAAHGQVPVLAGAGSNDTRASVALAQELSELGVDGLMLVTPYYNKPCQDGLFQHFAAVARATTLPVMLYNIEARTARNILPDTVGRLAAEVPNIVALKEASGSINQFAAMADIVPSGFKLYSGNDGDTPAILACGGVGVVSVVSHLAGRAMRQLMDAIWAGDWFVASPLYLKLMRLINTLFPASSPNPAPLKAGLELIGQPCGGLRLPLVSSPPVVREAIGAALVDLGLL